MKKTEKMLRAKRWWDVKTMFEEELLGKERTHESSFE